MPPKLFRNIVTLCFERRFYKQNSVNRLKSNILPPPFLGWLRHWKQLPQARHSWWIHCITLNQTYSFLLGRCKNVRTETSPTTECFQWPVLMITWLLRWIAAIQGPSGFTRRPRFPSSTTRGLHSTRTTPRWKTWWSQPWESMVTTAPRHLASFSLLTKIAWRACRWCHLCPWCSWQIQLFRTQRWPASPGSATALGCERTSSWKL